MVWEETGESEIERKGGGGGERERRGAREINIENSVIFKCQDDLNKKDNTSEKNAKHKTCEKVWFLEEKTKRHTVKSMS